MLRNITKSSKKIRVLFKWKPSLWMAGCWKQPGKYFCFPIRKTNTVTVSEPFPLHGSKPTHLSKWNNRWLSSVPLFLKPVTISPMYCDLEVEWTVGKKARRSLLQGYSRDCKIWTRSRTCSWRNRLGKWLEMKLIMPQLEPPQAIHTLMSLHESNELGRKHN